LVNVPDRFLICLAFKSFRRVCMPVRLRITNVNGAPDPVTVELEGFPNMDIDPHVAHNVRGAWRVVNGVRPRYLGAPRPEYRYDYSVTSKITLWANGAPTITGFGYLLSVPADFSGGDGHVNDPSATGDEDGNEVNVHLLRSWG
jgi:hypothetical protein